MLSTIGSTLLLAAGSFGPKHVIALLMGIALLLGLARLLGELARRLGQPMVLGELLAGVLLGQTVLGAINPAVFEYLFSQSDTDPTNIALKALIVLSATMLLLVAGLEVELSTALKQGKAAVLVAVVGMILPGALGFATGWFKPDWVAPGDDMPPLAFALFCGIALSITALPVIAKILIDLKMFKSDLGMLIMSAAMLNDMLGWMGFAVVLALLPASAEVATHAGWSIGMTLGLTVGFLVLMMTVVRVGIHKLLPFIQAHWSWPGGMIAFVMVVTLVCAAATEWIGVHAIFGAFIAGIAIGDSHHLRPRTRETIHEFVTNIFAPLFFASVGLSVNFVHAFAPLTVIIAVFIAFAGKIAGCWAGARMAGMKNRVSLAVGSGMVAQGTMGVILGQLALDAGLIKDELFVAIVIVALLTSFAAGPAMQKVLGLEQVKRLGDYLTDKGFIPSLSALNRRGAIEELAAAAAQITEIDVKRIVDTVWAREEIMHTGLGDGIAVPHARLADLAKPVVVLGRSPIGLDFDATDGKPAQIICMLLTSTTDHQSQLELLRMVAEAFATAQRRQRAMAATDYTQFLAALRWTEGEAGHGTE